MKTDVEELSPTRVRLTVEVPFEELKPNLDHAYREVGRQVRVPGFRPGRVPPRVIDQRVGRGAVLEQAVNDAVPELYGKALQEHEMFALGQPDVEITKLDDGKELAFTAEVDVRPKFDAARPRRAAGHRRRRGRHRRAGGGVPRRAARAVRLAEGRRPAGRGGRLRVDRPVGQRRRQAGRGRPGQRHVLRGRQRQHAGRPGRGAGRHVAPARPRRSHRAGRRRVRGPGGRRHGHRAQRQGQGAARRWTTSSPRPPASSTRWTSCAARPPPS